MMIDPVDFVRARLDEDEAIAKAVPHLERHERQGQYGLRFLSVESDHSHQDTAFVDQFDPSRRLREIAVMRRIVDACEATSEDDRMDAGTGYWEVAQEALLIAVLDLTTIWSDHPDFNSEWSGVDR